MHPLFDDGHLPDDFISNYDLENLRSDMDKEGWSRKFRRRFVEFGAHLCRLDFAPILNQSSRLRVPFWSHCVYYFYQYFTIRLIINTYQQFVFDYYKYKLNKFDQIIRRNDSFHVISALKDEDIKSFRAHLIEDYEKSRRTLKQFGAPFVNFSHLIENVWIFLIISTCLVYTLPQFYYKFWEQYDNDFIMSVLAHDRLQHSIDSLICDRVNSFISSSRVYNSVILASEAYIVKWHAGELRQDTREDLRNECHACRCLSRGKDSIEISSPTKDLRIKRIARNHRYLVQQVKLMALNGVFQPLNRRCDWLKDITTKYGQILVSVFVFLIFCQLATQVAIPNLKLLGAEVEFDLMDILFQLEFSVCLTAAMFAGSFYVTMVAMICLDQLYLVSKLSQMINHCILENSDRLKDYLRSDVIDINKNQFYSKNHSISDIREIFSSFIKLPEKSHSLIEQTILVQPENRGGLTSITNHKCMTMHGSTGPSSSGCRLESSRKLRIRDANRFGPIEEDINLCLLQTLMHYKIFVGQSKPALKSIQVFTMIALGVTSILPIVTRLLLAYLDSRQKGFSIAICVLVLIYGNIGFILIGKLYTRCLDIYRHLQSLIAHSVAIDHCVRMQTGHEAYDKHLIWLLRKELNQPERLIDQFAIRLLGDQWKLTYSSLIKFHFWWGVLIISTIVIDPSSRNASDVLGGVWKFYSSADLHINRFLNGSLKV